MEKLIDHGEFFNPYRILDNLETFLTEFGLSVRVTENRKTANTYHHTFSSGRFECRITNSHVSSTDFHILIKIWQKDRGWIILFDEVNYNLAIRPLYDRLIKLVNTSLHKYVSDLELPAQRAVKIDNLVG